MPAWTHRNLHTQGYELADSECRALRVGLRFPTAACFALVVVALVLDSALLMAAVVPVGVVAGWGRFHPFDHVWNRALRHLVGSPEVPPTPRRRRLAFQLGAVWVVLLAAVLAAGHHSLAVGLALPLLAVCGLVTVTNFCVPSTIIKWWDERAPGT